MYVLGQEAVSVSYSKRIDKHVAGLVTPSNLRQCIDQPEPANQKGRLRQAEIVGSDIPHNVETTPKFMANRLNGCGKARIVGCHQAEFGEQKCAGIKVIALESRRKRLALGIPGAFKHLFSDAFRYSTPIGCAVRQAEVSGNRRKAVASGPAHRRRMRMHALAPAIFP